MDPKTYDKALGAALSEVAVEVHGSIRQAAVLARLRHRRVRRILAGRAPAGPVELKRLAVVLQLDWAAFEERVNSTLPRRKSGWRRRLARSTTGCERTSEQHRRHSRRIRIRRADEAPARGRIGPAGCELPDSDRDPRLGGAAMSPHHPMRPPHDGVGASAREHAAHSR